MWIPHEKGEKLSESIHTIIQFLVHCLVNLNCIGQSCFLPLFSRVVEGQLASAFWAGFPSAVNIKLFGRSANKAKCQIVKRQFVRGLFLSSSRCLASSDGKSACSTLQYSSIPFKTEIQELAWETKI